MNKVVSKRPNLLQFRQFSLNDENSDEEEKKEDNEEDEEEDVDDTTQHDRDELLVHILFKTEILNVIMNACSRSHQTTFEKSNNSIEVGFVAHLTRLAKLINQACEANEITKMGVETEFPDWVEFVSTVLQPRIKVREGELCR